MSKPFYVLSDTDLLIWAESFSSHLSATPAAFFVTADQAADMEGRTNAFSSALSAWRNPSTRTPVAMQQKSSARANLLEMAKYLVATTNNNPAMTDEKRDELGIKARKKPSPIPAPEVSPLIDIEAVVGRTVKIRLHAEGRKGRPSGAKGASVFTAIGDEAPTDTAAWKFEGLTSRTSFEITFPQSASANTVWITANWYNERGETGVACAPVSVNLPASAVLPQGDALKMAA